MTSKAEQIKERLIAVSERVGRSVRERARQVIDGQTDTDAMTTTERHRDQMETLAGEPPVVARLVVEIRSDGSRTIARGALKDELSGEQVALEAKGSSPIQLAAQLARNLLTTPLAASQFAKAMLAARRDRDEES